jgi:hypothetical protein
MLWDGVLGSTVGTHVVKNHVMVDIGYAILEQVHHVENVLDF